MKPTLRIDGYGTFVIARNLPQLYGCGIEYGYLPEPMTYVNAVAIVCVYEEDNSNMVNDFSIDIVLDSENYIRQSPIQPAHRSEVDWSSTNIPENRNTPRRK
jgi:hypothetical protein